MKISAMIGTPDLQTETLAVFAGPDLGASLRSAAAFGFDGVELMLKNPALLDGDEIHSLLDGTGLELAGLCSGHVFGEDRLGLIGPDPDNCRAAMERMKTLVDFGSGFGPGTILNIGRSRGRADLSDPEDSWARAIEAFRQLSDYAEPKGIRLALEPVNHNEVNYIITTQDGVRMCEDVDRANFGLMLDTYHMDIEDADIHDSFREARQYCWHVHYSDSNRCWPGSGDIDFPAVTRTLEEIGYDGFVSAEIAPLPDPETAARSTVNYLRQYIPKAG
jgi:sugar phosphate isomerase/epimerase